MSKLLQLQPDSWLKLNAGLQKKKNALRKELKARGVLKKGAVNEYDKYRYFSEAQYKELFTELFSDFGLELSFTELAYETFEGTEKQANGRMPRLEFKLQDIDTGFYEETAITGEGIDKGDKAGYKAYTGALKYYLANTFMVATGDDPENESPDVKMNERPVRGASAKQISLILKYLDGVELANELKRYGVSLVSELNMVQASAIINAIKRRMNHE